MGGNIIVYKSSDDRYYTTNHISQQRQWRYELVGINVDVGRIQQAQLNFRTSVRKRRPRSSWHLLTVDLISLSEFLGRATLWADADVLFLYSIPHRIQNITTATLPVHDHHKTTATATTLVCDSCHLCHKNPRLPCDAKASRWYPINTVPHDNAKLPRKKSKQTNVFSEILNMLKLIS